MANEQGDLMLEDDEINSGVGVVVAVAAAEDEDDPPEEATVAEEREDEAALPQDLRLFPLESELDELPSPRAKEALKVWYLRLRELYAFIRTHGNCNVPQKYESNPPLGIWVNKQRSTRATLGRGKAAALDAVGFDWGKKKGEQAWNTQYDELVEYKRVHGDCLVPTKSIVNPALGRWVSTQRSQYKNWQADRETSTLTEDKVTKLKGIGFVWSMVDDE